MAAQGLIGKQVGKYRADTELPALGHGQAYLGQHVGLAKACVLKTLPPELSQNAIALEACRQTIARAAKITHAALATVQDAFDADGQFYVVYGVLQGKPLEVDRKHPKAPAEVARLFKLPLEGLKALHDAGVPHRAIRPSSLMFHDQEARWIDFGLQYDFESADSKAPHVIEAAKFASPEVALGKATTPTSDMYSLGLLLYYALTGIVPFDGGDARSILYLQAYDEPLPPSSFVKTLPQDLNDLVLRMISKNPAKRPGSIKEVLDALGTHAKSAESKPEPKVAKKGEPRANKHDTQRAEPQTHEAHAGLLKYRKALIMAGSTLVGLLVLIGLILVLLPRGGTNGTQTPANPLNSKQQEDAPLEESDVAEAHYKRRMADGDSAFKRGEFETARVLYDQARELKDTPEVRRKLEACLTAIDQRRVLKEARDAYDKIMRMVDEKATPAEIGFECEEFMRRFADTDYAKHVRRIQDLAKRIIDARAKIEPPPTAKNDPPPKNDPKGPDEPVENPIKPPVKDPPKQPDPPPDTSRDELGKARDLIGKKDYAGARKELIRLLTTGVKEDAAAELSRALQLEKWDKAFNGKDMDKFNVVTLSDSGAEISKEAPEILAWARENDVVLWQFKSFDPKKHTGVTLEFLMEEKTQDENAIAIVFDRQSGNTYKELLFTDKEVLLRSRVKREFKTMGTAVVPRREALGRWHRLTVVVEGETTVALFDDSLVWVGPSADAKFTDDTRILLQGCRGRIRDIRTRKP